MSLFTLDTNPDISLLNSENVINPLFHKSKVLLSEETSRKASKLAVSPKKSSNTDKYENNINYYGLPPPNVDISYILKSEATPRDTDKRNTICDNDSDIDLDELLSKRDANKELKTSDVGSLNSLDSLEKFTMSERKLAEKRKIEKSKTKGTGWFNLPATELTDEIKNDLQIIQMRSALDPKHFYRKNEMKVLPKYFQIGKVLSSPLDHYSNGTQSNKKQSLVDELLKDAEFQKYNKQKYKKLVETKKSKGYYKAQKKSKKLKKQKK